MQRSLSFCAVALIALAGCASAPQVPADSAADLDSNNVARLDAALAGDWRSAENRARDRYRHPRETLAFFGVRPEQTVIEVTPGSGAWYAEVLAPYLRDNGRYIAAMVDPASVAEGRGRDYQTSQRDGLQARFDAAPMQFDRARMVAFDPTAPRFGPSNSADVVLTFRNVHNWRMSGQAEAMFKGFYDVLRPGGVLGVVEHRAKADVPADDRSGYVGTSQVIALAQAAGFRVDGSSEVNANPKDTRDHPNGVWMLPPSNRHDAADAAKYTDIGESDRMTLRFVKP
ncbi:methyltransferase [Luteimonas sp. 3794]|uniref:class I SAM-dependent methyltransferase n=1 Tax=Luteimonas sp. 3794 TaxID=2817730 RepID=UPI00285CC8F9|nr:methyltransferase [Luteimonas sp. 3794]MDR6990047.1 putative methyltransferase [Luteimonas sp. 3794]